MRRSVWVVADGAQVVLGNGEGGVCNLVSCKEVGK